MEFAKKSLNDEIKSGNHKFYDSSDFDGGSITFSIFDMSNEMKIELENEGFEIEDNREEYPEEHMDHKDFSNVKISNQNFSRFCNYNTDVILHMMRMSEEIYNSFPNTETKFLEIMEKHGYKNIENLEEEKEEPLKLCNLLESSDCSICIDSIAEKTEIYDIPCGHKFHKDCLNTWLKNNNTCPFCRAVLKESDDYESDYESDDESDYESDNESDDEELEESDEDIFPNVSRQRPHVTEIINSIFDSLETKHRLGFHMLVEIKSYVMNEIEQLQTTCEVHFKDSITIIDIVCNLKATDHEKLVKIQKNTIKKNRCLRQLVRKYGNHVEHHIDQNGNMIFNLDIILADSVQRNFKVDKKIPDYETQVLNQIPSTGWVHISSAYFQFNFQTN